MCSILYGFWAEAEPPNTFRESTENKIQIPEDSTTNAHAVNTPVQAISPVRRK